MPRLSTSTWSLHRAIGITYPDSPAAPNRRPETTYGGGTIALHDIPARLAAMEIHTLEICHFHLPKDDGIFLRDLRAALDSAGVELFSLLIDDGDITDPMHGERDLRWIGEWLEVGARLGAKCARVIAGKQDPTPQTLEKSRRGLSELARHAAGYNIRLMTENWHGLLSSPQQVLDLLDSLDGQVGLCADFGNWKGPTKYDDLARIFPHAESCHAKCFFSDATTPDRDDYIRCLELTRAAGFDGPYTLIYDGPGDDEWSGLGQEIELVRPYL